MKKILSLMTAFSMLAGLSCAVVTVDGVGGGSTTFATLDDAIDYVIANPSEDTIEITTDGPIAGPDLTGKALAAKLTIRGATGHHPWINSQLYLMPTTESATTISLENLRVERPDASKPAIMVGCNLEAFDIDVIQPGSGTAGYEAGISMATSTTLTDAEVDLTSCSINAHNTIQIGRAARDTFLTSCTLYSFDDIPGYDFVICHNMNYPPNDYFGGSFTDHYGLPPIVEPRNLTLSRCQVTAGKLLGWPANTLAGFYQNQDNCIGTFTAINTVFISKDGGSAMTIGDPTATNELPDDNPCAVVLDHCTFHKEQNYGDIYILEDANVQINNSLFDNPISNYCVLLANPVGTSLLTGEANTYNIPAGYVVNGAGGFENNGNFHVREASGDLSDLITAGDGHLLPALDSTTMVMIAGQAIPLSPPVDTDMDGESRPQPSSAFANDIGADEVNETLSSVHDWQMF